MEIWIRSQDKKQIIKAKHIELEGYLTIYADDWEMGNYSTEEKALKVMDRIQHEIVYGNYDEVYQMPQDEEVE